MEPRQRNRASTRDPRADLWCFEIDDDGDGDSGAWSLLLDDDKGPSPRNAATLMVMDTQSVETILGNGEISDCGSCNKKYFLLQGDGLHLRLHLVSLVFYLYNLWKRE